MIWLSVRWWKLVTVFTNFLVTVKKKEIIFTILIFQKVEIVEKSVFFSSKTCYAKNVDQFFASRYLFVLIICHSIWVSTLVNETVVHLFRYIKAIKRYLHSCIEDTCRRQIYRWTKKKKDKSQEWYSLQNVLSQILKSLVNFRPQNLKMFYFEKCLLKEGNIKFFSHGYYTICEFWSQITWTQFSKEFNIYKRNELAVQNMTILVIKIM